MELGCDARGYSRAGYDTSTWYCAILAGRHGPELSKMREVSIFLCLRFINSWQFFVRNNLATLCSQNLPKGFLNSVNYIEMTSSRWFHICVHLHIELTV